MNSLTIKCGAMTPSDHLETIGAIGYRFEVDVMVAFGAGMEVELHRLLAATWSQASDARDRHDWAWDERLGRAGRWLDHQHTVPDGAGCRGYGGAR